jgi:hypothetical protein
MSEIYYQYFRGESLPSTIFHTPDGAELFGTFIWEDWLRDESTAQEDMFGETYWKKVHPIELQPDRVHLLRPPDTREGRRQAEIESLDRSLELCRIQELQQQLKEMRSYE